MVDELKAKGTSQASFSLSARIRFRSGFAIPHLRAASEFALKATQIEEQHRGQELSSSYDEIRFNVLAATMLSVASLEANINEFLADDRRIPGLEKPALDMIVELLESSSILEKYQKVLVLLNLLPLDASREPHQSTAILIQLRNSLVHFKPEWHDEQLLHARLGERLRGKFQLSPFFPDTHVLFPDRAMSAGCANWAVRVALEYMKVFHMGSDTKFKFGEALYVELMSKHSADA